MCVSQEGYECSECSGEDENCSLCGGTGYIDLDNFVEFQLNHVITLKKGHENE